MQRQFGNYIFEYVCEIQPDLQENGQIKTYMPQSKYNNKKNLPLNRYGTGPFCHIRIPTDLPYTGVYILTIDGEPYYVGECEHLSKRYNAGYGQISPKNCFKGGQPTNCRINNLIYETIRNGSYIELWFLKTGSRKGIEAELIQTLNVRTKWNRKD